MLCGAARYRHHGHNCCIFTSFPTASQKDRGCIWSFPGIVGPSLYLVPEVAVNRLDSQAYAESVSVGIEFDHQRLVTINAMIASREMCPIQICRRVIRAEAEHGGAIVFLLSVETGCRRLNKEIKGIDGSTTAA